MAGIYDLIRDDVGPFVRLQEEVIEQLAGDNTQKIYARVAVGDEVAIDEVWLPNQLAFQLGLFERECVLLWLYSPKNEGMLFLVCLRARCYMNEAEVARVHPKVFAFFEEARLGDVVTIRAVDRDMQGMALHKFGVYAYPQIERESAVQDAENEREPNREVLETIVWTHVRGTFQTEAKGAAGPAPANTQSYVWTAYRDPISGKHLYRVNIYPCWFFADGRLQVSSTLFVDTTTRRLYAREEGSASLNSGSYYVAVIAENQFDRLMRDLDSISRSAITTNPVLNYREPL